MKHLDEQGVVVVKSVLDQNEVEKAKELYWDWAEGLNTGLKREDSATWKDEAWPGHETGISSSHGLAHSEAAWFTRTRPNVKSCFAKIWNDDDLVCSYDCVLVWRPWFGKNGDDGMRLPITEGLHIDQSPSKKKGRHGVQGIVPMLDITEEIGGTEVIPGSHLLQEEHAKVYNTSGDWVMLHESDPN
jgi:ectoine hydroxylase-related dioxygenase (phytanoyl-CoA dioxygenase family)